MAAGLPPETRHIPLGLAHFLGAAFESLYHAVGARSEPPLTRFLVEQMSTSHWFNIAAARRDLGYEPQVNMIEGLHRLSQHLSAERAQKATAKS